MFEEFSSGYYLGRLYVEPFDGEYAVMQRDQHQLVNEQLYASDDGVDRLDVPLVMKVDHQHFPVLGEEGIPNGTLGLPAVLLEKCDIRNPPTLTEVLLAKADRAAQLLSFTGRRPDSDPPVGT